MNKTVKANVEGTQVERARTENNSRPNEGALRRRSTLNTRDILRVDGLSAKFIPRWVTEDNVEKYKSCGGEIVTHDEITGVGDSRVTSGQSTGAAVTIRSGGTALYLMKMPVEFYDQDKQELQAQVDATEASLRMEEGSGRDGTFGKVSIG